MVRQVVEIASGVLANRLCTLMTPGTTVMDCEACSCLHNNIRYPTLQNADLDNEDDQQKALEN